MRITLLFKKMPLAAEKLHLVNAATREKYLFSTDSPLEAYANYRI